MRDSNLSIVWYTSGDERDDGKVVAAGEMRLKFSLAGHRKW